MAFDRSDYTIAVKTTADTSPIKLSKEAFAQLTGEVNATAAAAKAAETTHIAHANAVHDEGKAAHEASVSHRDLHEAMQLLRISAGDALGPIGELAHFLSNPYLLAVAGITLAVKMLVDEYEKARENTLKLTEASEAQRLLFANAGLDAVREHTAAMAKWADEQKHAHDSIDYATEAMKRQITVAQELLTATNAGIDSAEALYEARIKLSELEGKISSPEADEAIRRQKAVAQAQKDTADDVEKTAEYVSHVNRSANATRESGEAAAKIPGLEGDAEHVGHMLNVATGDVPMMQTAADAAAQALHEAESKWAPYKNLDPKEVAEWSNARRAGYTQAKEGMDKAKPAAETTRATLLKQKDRVTQYTDEKASIQADIDSAKALVKARDELARTELEEALAEKGKLDRDQKARAVKEAAERETAAVNRHAELERLSQSGKLTPDQRLEYEGMTEPHLADRRNRSGGIDRGALSGAEIAVRNLTTDRNRSGGHAGGDVLPRIHELLERVIGMGESTQSAQGNNHAILDELRRRLGALEGQARNNRWQSQ